MRRNDETFGDRMRKITLLQWGLFCFLGAGFSQVASLAQGPAPDRASAAGRAAAGLVFVVAGVVLIVLHFVRPKRSVKPPAATNPTSDKPKRAAPGLPPRRPGAKRP